MVLEYYIKLGFVTFHPWILPHEIIPDYSAAFGPCNDKENLDVTIAYHGSCSRLHAQKLVYNDCMYKYMDQHTHIIFTDLDEFVVPTEDVPLLDMIKHVSDEQQGSTVHSYMLRAAWFCVSPKQASSGSVTQSFMRWTQYWGIWKSITVPRLANIQAVHFCKAPLHNFTKEINIDAKIALIHHYREGCQSEEQPKVTDTKMSRYEAPLLYNMQKVMEALLLDDKFSKH